MTACAISAAFGQQAPQGDQARDKAELARKSAQDAREAMRQQTQEMRDQTRALTRDVERVMDASRLNFEIAQQMAPMPPMPPMPPKAYNLMGSGTYESGKYALDAHKYEKAIESFDRVINAKTPSSRADGAYYWKAYALNKLGKRDEALAALAELARQFPQSNWLNDAKALQAEVQQAKGQPVSPEDQADEDLKLYAINALISSDADRAVPLLETLLNNPKQAPRLKERALFVLAQSHSDKAHEIVARYAKGGASNPDLQLTAVQYLGTFRSNESRQVLADVYKSTGDVNVKRAVLRSFEISRDVEHLAAIAKTEQNNDLRYEAIRQIGNMHDDQAVAILVSLYGAEKERSVKSEILNSLANANAIKQLIDCARKETDPELKVVVVRRLSGMKSKEAIDYLAELLK